MKSKCFASLCVLLLLCASEAAAQPTCSAHFSMPFVCYLFNADFVFAGRVVSLTDMRPDEQGNSRQAEVDSIHGYMRGKAVVLVDTLFKGELAGEVEIVFNTVCWGTIKKNKSYVFNVRQTAEGLQADKWSVELDRFNKDDLAYFMDMMRLVFKGGRQPRLFGTLRRVTYGIASNAFPPVSDVTVVAEKDGEKFEARTGADGRYEFQELPDGDYKVYPLLPKSLRPPDDSYRRSRERHEDRVTVTNRILCGTLVDFLAWDNGVIAGRVEDADGRPVKFMNHWIIDGLRRQGRDLDENGKPLKWFRVALYWLIDKNVRQSAPYPAYEAPGLKDGEFAFVNLPPGPYRLEFIGGDTEFLSEDKPEHFVYLKYPGDVSGKNGPQVIDLAEGQQIRDIVIRLRFPIKR